MVHSQFSPTLQKTAVSCRRFILGEDRQQRSVTTLGSQRSPSGGQRAHPLESAVGVTSVPVWSWLTFYARALWRVHVIAKSCRWRAAEQLVPACRLHALCKGLVLFYFYCKARDVVYLLQQCSFANIMTNAGCMALGADRSATCSLLKIRIKFAGSRRSST